MISNPDDFALAGDVHAQVRVARLTLASHMRLLVALPAELLTPTVRRSSMEMADAAVALIVENVPGNAEVSPRGLNAESR